jgi:hypothetical protein
MDRGFSLGPLRETILDGELRSRWPDDTLAVLVVLMAHESSRTRVAGPSLDRLAALAGVSKETAAKATDGLARTDWLQKRRLPVPGGRSRFEYTFLYSRRGAGDKSCRWFRLEHHIVLRGAWAAMPPATRRLYLTLLALSSDGRFALLWPGDGASWREVFEETYLGETFTRARFVSAKHLAPRNLQALAGLEPRTFQRSWSWLTTNKLVVDNGPGVWPDDPSGMVLDHFADGVVMPYLPDIHSSAVVERLQRLAKEAEEAEAVTPGARRLVNRTRTMRHSHPKTATLTTPKRDTGEPEQCFEQGFEQCLNNGSTRGPC